MLLLPSGLWSQERYGGEGKESTEPVGVAVDIIGSWTKQTHQTAVASCLCKCADVPGLIRPGKLQRCALHAELSVARCKLRVQNGAGDPLHRVRLFATLQADDFVAMKGLGKEHQPLLPVAWRTGRSKFHSSCNCVVQTLGQCEIKKMLPAQAP